MIVFTEELKKVTRQYLQEFNEEPSILRNLSKDESLYISKRDKGKGVFIMDNVEYIEKMKEIVNDESIFEVVDRDPIIKQENKLNRKSLKMTTLSQKRSISFVIPQDCCQQEFMDFRK